MALISITTNSSISVNAPRPGLAPDRDASASNSCVTFEPACQPATVLPSPGVEPNIRRPRLAGRRERNPQPSPLNWKMPSWTLPAPGRASANNPSHAVAWIVDSVLAFRITCGPMNGGFVAFGDAFPIFDHFRWECPAVLASMPSSPFSPRAPGSGPGGIRRDRHGLLFGSGGLAFGSGVARSRVSSAQPCPCPRGEFPGRSLPVVCRQQPPAIAL